MPALAAIAPQDPRSAVKELRAVVIASGMKGAVVNSHTQGEYLDEPKYWEIFEAAEALDVPLYLHPNTPPPAMIGPFLPRGLDGAIYGFAVETGLHLLRIIVAGVFDRFPKLQDGGRAPRRGIAVLALPPRLHAPRRWCASNRYEGAKPLKQQAQRLPEGERLGDDERHAVGAGDPASRSRCSAWTACCTRWTTPTSSCRRK